MQTFINNSELSGLRGLRDAVSFNTASSPTTDFSSNTAPLIAPPVVIPTTIEKEEEDKLFGIPKLWIMLGGAGLLIWLITKD